MKTIFTVKFKKKGKTEVLPLSFCCQVVQPRQSLLEDRTLISVTLAAKQLLQPERSCRLQLLNSPISVVQCRVKVLFLSHTSILFHPRNYFGGGAGYCPRVRRAYFIKCLLL